MHFTERFFDIFHNGLVLSAKDGSGSLSWDKVARTVESLIAVEENLSLPPGFSPADREEAKVPVLLWLDERFQNSARPDAEKWYDYSFQRKYLGTNRGGELFFESLREILTDRLRQTESPADDGSGTLASLWVRPGTGPDPTESVLDAYALSLMLGYQGRFYQGDEELETLRALAREQLAAWSVRAPSESRKADPRFRAVLKRLWRDYGWAVTHVLLPAAVVLLLWLRRGSIIDSLPF
ncbi:MAG: DotU family type IV/VI secretion system protein [Deltaproteobacteria bacterium]|jgi:type VI protein secretion system component VasF|nr:DotU family type IV/VI secretion system protein [Deltaproteobacteria bacterium]